MEKSLLISEIVIILLSALIFLKLMIKKVEYFFTVCFVASACASILILGETVKQINYSIGVLVNAISTVVLITVYFAGGSLFKKYSEVVVPDNRVKSISVSSVVILVYLIACFINIRNMNIYICILQLILIVSVYVCFISAINKQRKISGIAKIYEVNEKLKEIAYLDSATNVKNKRAYRERIDELDRTADSESKIYAIVLDIDHFKLINDTYGHSKGDEALVKTASYLMEILNDDAFEIYRMGGDEFAIIATGISEEILKEKLNYIDNLKNNKDFGLVLSFGYAFADFSQDDPIYTAFVRADKNMYKMKKAKNALR